MCAGGDLYAETAAYVKATEVVFLGRNESD